METGICALTGSRDILVFKGKDRAKTLHNLCTQDILKANPGDCLEAFITSLQGKILAFIEIMILEDFIIVLSNSKGLEESREHIRKYSIFDDTQLIEPASEFHGLFIAGSPAIDQFSLMMGVDLSVIDNKCKLIKYKEQDLMIKASILSNSIEIISDKVMIDDIKMKLDNAQVSFNDFNLIRIRSAWPYSGIDTKSDNLPQEIDRDNTAISFRKGCYLGQETVARLDALGHVNKKLMGLSFNADNERLAEEIDLPCPILNRENQPVGDVRSLAFDPKSKLYYGLAMIRLKSLESEINMASFPGIALTFNSLDEFRTI